MLVSVVEVVTMSVDVVKVVVSLVVSVVLTVETVAVTDEVTVGVAVLRNISVLHTSPCIRYIRGRCRSGCFRRRYSDSVGCRCQCDNASSWSLDTLAYCGCYRGYRSEQCLRGMRGRF